MIDVAKELEIARWPPSQCLQLRTVLISELYDVLRQDHKGEDLSWTLSEE